jgi:hypothetical protein
MYGQVGICYCLGTEVFSTSASPTRDAGDGISDCLPSFSAGMKFSGLSARDHIKTENALGCDLSNFPTAARDCSAMFSGKFVANGRATCWFFPYN